ncbi:hypothetical protein [Paenibacillus guangzhouensis]|uniref:hypothetical protein n=1 Tax=Paenibacillus guangzhouensis TaxID=1473112 RepID=UPI0012669FA8|nr:hypothetical protein [Paenibacillus guangzhouensis]
MPVSAQSLYGLIGKPVGVSMMDGTGVTGVLCSVQHDDIYLMEYLYHTQFATKHYPLSQIQAVHPFPGCAWPAGSWHQSMY